MTNETSEATLDLLSKIKAGDNQARDRLLERTVPALRRWARGRLPQWARSLSDTQDLVQDVVVRALPRLSSFEPVAPGGLQAFLRTAVNNQIIDEIRKAKVRPTADVSLELEPAPSPSPLELAMKREGHEKYVAALATLNSADQDVIRARIDRQLSYEEIAVALGKPTASAARMAVNRAIARLVKAMADKR